MQIIVDPEFKGLLGDLTEEEYAGLEAAIVADGCEIPLIVWKSKNILVDGHNRLEICKKHEIEYKVSYKEFTNRARVKMWMIGNQAHRRNWTVGQRVLMIHMQEDLIAEIEAEAQKNKRESGKLHGNHPIPEQVYLPIDKPAPEPEPVDTDAEVAKLAGSSRYTSAKAKKIAKNGTEQQKKDVLSGKKAVGTVYKEIREVEKEVEKEAKIVEPFKLEAQRGKKSNSTFNATNDNIEWAKWTWNPVTGCLHDCEYCYARDIAERFYPEKFVPTFRPERLDAPDNTTIPAKRINEPGIYNVFVCSMADLFGEWVNQSWIDQILNEVRHTPQWTYIFLTKNPKRLVGLDFPDNAWVGATVDVQARVADVEKYFPDIKARIKFVSCEPLQEKVIFSSMAFFNWLIIGARSKNSRLPEFQPKWEWVESLFIHARNAGVNIYFKPNLTVMPKEFPNAEK